MNKIYSLPILCFFFFVNTLTAQNNEYRLSFEIINDQTNKPLEFVNIAIMPCACGGTTNFYGKYSRKLPEDTYTIKISYLGFEDYSQTIVLNEDTSLTIKLLEKEEEL